MVFVFVDNAKGDITKSKLACQHKTCWSCSRNKNMRDFFLFHNNPRLTMKPGQKQRSIFHPGGALVYDLLNRLLKRLSHTIWYPITLLLLVLCVPAKWNSIPPGKACHSIFGLSEQVTYKSLCR